MMKAEVDNCQLCSGKDSPIAACHVYDRQDDFVREIVDPETLPSNSLILTSQMNLVEYQDVEDVHDQSSEQ